MRNLSRRRAIIAQAMLASAHLAARPVTTAQSAPQELSRGEQVRHRPDIEAWNLTVKDKKAAKRRAKGK